MWHSDCVKIITLYVEKGKEKLLVVIANNLTLLCIMTETFGLSFLQKSFSESKIAEKQ